MRARKCFSADEWLSHALEAASAQLERKMNQLCAEEGLLLSIWSFIHYSLFAVCCSSWTARSANRLITGTLVQAHLVNIELNPWIYSHIDKNANSIGRLLVCWLIHLLCNCWLHLPSVQFSLLPATSGCRPFSLPIPNLTLSELYERILWGGWRRTQVKGVMYVQNAAACVLLAMASQVWAFPFTSTCWLSIHLLLSKSCSLILQKEEEKILLLRLFSLLKTSFKQSHLLRSSRV